VDHIELPVPDHDHGLISRLFGMLTFAKRVYFNHNGWQDDIDRPDIIIGSGPPPFGVYAAGRLAKKWDLPFIAEIRDVWPEAVLEYGDFSDYHPGIIGLKWLEKRIYRMADHIISPQPGISPHVNQVARRDIPFTHIPQGINLDQIGEWSAPREKGEGDEIQETFDIWYCGAHRPTNKLHMVLDGVEDMVKRPNTDHIRFHFIGDGPKKPGLIKRAQEQGLPITFYDPVPKEQVFDIIRKADAYIGVVYTKLLQEFGQSLNKLAEYLALGRPTIMLINAFNDPVAEYQAGVSVNSDNPSELAEAMIELSKTPHQERVEMGRRGHEFAHQFHNFDRLSDLWLSVSKQVMN
jgi:glycosyltransferase involved in cell wall biosynthesis